MTQLINPVLLCGGSGTRLWPLSRKSYPKQFVKMVGEESLYQASARRLSGRRFCGAYDRHRRRLSLHRDRATGRARDRACRHPDRAFRQEHRRRHICAAALALEARAPGALMLVAPSDHVIPERAPLSAMPYRPQHLPLLQDSLSPLASAQTAPRRAMAGLSFRRPTPDFAPVRSPSVALSKSPTTPRPRRCWLVACTCGTQGYSCSPPPRSLRPLPPMRPRF